MGVELPASSEKAEEISVRKLDWVRPEVKQMRAGDAENGAGSISDDFVNFS